MSEKLSDSELKMYPLTPDRWEDFEKLFGKSGACYGCWCMYYRMLRKDFNSIKAQGHKESMKTLVFSDTILGILAYHDNKPIGWCGIGPIDGFPRVLYSRSLKPANTEGLWSIVCFFVDKNYRKMRVTSFLLRSAIHYAAENGAKAIEAYPVKVESQMRDESVFSGTYSLYAKNGFLEVRKRNSRSQYPIVRYTF